MRQLLRNLSTRFRSEVVPPGAEAERRRDAEQGLAAQDPGPARVIDVTLAWLCEAQDCSTSADGGVARDYSLIRGWSTSYAETTGYIVPTFIELAHRLARDDLHQRARRMLDWLVGIQLPTGGYHGGKVDSLPRAPVTFNTGQILLGMAAGTAAYGDERYLGALHRAASWLRDSLDDDGCWRRYPTPFASPGEKAYETHVSWGLFEAERVAPGHGYAEAGLRQVSWALTKQLPNGWFASNCLSDADGPLTHTIGYVLRGVLEAHRLAPRPELLGSARRLADSLCSKIQPDGRLAGALDRQFRPTVNWVCLTGSVQLALCLFILHRMTGDMRYLDAGRRANAYVRRTVQLEGPPQTRGGVKGSFPIDGQYGRWEYLNWAAKFCIDANLMELDLSGEPTP